MIGELNFKKFVLTFFLFFYFFFNVKLLYAFKEDLNIRNKIVISYANAVERAAPAVVSIQTTQEIPVNTHPMFNDPIFKFFFW